MSNASIWLPLSNANCMTCPKNPYKSQLDDVSYKTHYRNLSHAITPLDKYTRDIGRARHEWLHSIRCHSVLASGWILIANNVISFAAIYTICFWL